MGKENVNLLAGWGGPARRPRGDFGYRAPQNVA